MSFIQTDETLEAAAHAVGITLADIPIVLADPTHRHHANLVAALSAQPHDEVGAGSN